MYVDNLIKKQDGNIIWAGLINLKLKNIQNRNENISNNCTPAESPVLAPPSRPHCVRTYVSCPNCSRVRDTQPAAAEPRGHALRHLVRAGAGWRVAGVFLPVSGYNLFC